jgi:hypothetical protein
MEVVFREMSKWEKRLSRWVGYWGPGTTNVQYLPTNN